jgi:hypothetical protein
MRATQASKSLRDFERAAVLLRTRFKNFEKGITIIDQGMQRFGNEAPVDYLHYLKILLCRDFSSRKIDEAVSELHEKYPASAFMDDALAELANVQVRYRNQVGEGRATVMRLLREYPSANACDNALNMLAKRYYSDHDFEKAREIDSIIIRKYPRNRFAGYAKIRLRGLEDEDGRQAGTGRGAQPLFDFKTITNKGTGQFHIICGSYSTSDHAYTHLVSLVENGCHSAKVVVCGGKYRVSMNSFSSQNDAKMELKKYANAWVMKY